MEGANEGSVWLLVCRRAAWAGWLALSDHDPSLTCSHMSDLARSLEDAAHTVDRCTRVLSATAAEAHHRGQHDIGAVIDGVALLLGRRPS